MRRRTALHHRATGGIGRRRRFDVLQRLERCLRRLHRVAVRLLELGEDLFAVDVDRARRLDAEPNLIAAHLEHRHDDLVPDHDALVRTTREHEHGVLPPWRPPWAPFRSIRIGPTRGRASSWTRACRSLASRASCRAVATCVVQLATASGARTL